MKRAILITTLVAVLIGVGGAWAIPPDRGEDFFYAEGPIGSCPGGPVLCEEVVGTIVWKLFFFRTGDPRRYREKTQAIGNIFDCSNGDDHTLDYNPLNYTYTYDYVADETIVHGVWALITVPGYGQIFNDVGNIIFADGEVVFEAGKHQWFNDDFDAICEYLINGE